MKTILSLLTFLFVCAPLAVQASTELEEKYGHVVSTISVPPGAAIEDVKEGILKASINRKWVIRQQEDGMLQITMLHRSWDAKLTLLYDEETITIHSDSWRLKKSTGERFKRKDPEGWIENLARDIPVFISRTLYLED